MNVQYTVVYDRGIEVVRCSCVAPSAEAAVEYAKGRAARWNWTFKLMWVFEGLPISIP